MACKVRHQGRGRLTRAQRPHRSELGAVLFGDRCALADPNVVAVWIAYPKVAVAPRLRLDPTRVVASGREPRTLEKIFEGSPRGTLFLAQGKSITPWKRWIGFSAQSKGRVALDEGAVKAIAGDGRSLLAIGVRRVKGLFLKGDVISLVDPSEREFARGLTNYSSDDLQRIRGLTSAEFDDVLGHVPYEEVIHRDNLLVLDSTDASP